MSEVKQILPVPVPAGPSMSNQRECQICFSPYGIGAKYCPRCGAQTWPELPCNEPEIVTEPNGIFAGTVIGVKASCRAGGKMHVAFGPDKETATSRLVVRLNKEGERYSLSETESFSDWLDHRKDALEAPVCFEDWLKQNGDAIAKKHEKNQQL